MALWRLAAAVALLAAGMVTAATAAVSIKPAPGAPDPRPMVLVSADLGGARVTEQGYAKDDGALAYSRGFQGGAVGSTDLLIVLSEAEIRRGVQIALSTLREQRAFAGTALFRDVLRESIAGVDEISSVFVGKPRSLNVGDGGFDIAIVMRALGERFEMHMSVFRVERVLGSLLTAGGPGERVSLATQRKLAGIMADRMRAELSPAATRVPVISGTAQEGSTLAATTGTWIHKPTGYAYQWQRCDAAGEACAPIPGATSATYVLVSPDVGSTIRVAVTARNSVGSFTATSLQTAVVAPSTPPVNTSPPTITGSATPGQTLTGATGSWSGAPTGYAYQWQRCDEAVVACANVAGATGQTYLVGAGDAGSRIRLAVTATNAAGSTTAVSASTTAVP